MFVQRDFNRTEDDDFKINVEHHLNETNEAVPIYAFDTPTRFKVILCWEIKSRYE